MKKYIGIDLGGSHIGAGLVNEHGEILNKLEKEINASYECEAIVNGIGELISNLIKESNLNINEIEYIGIGIPGIVYEDRIYTPNLNIKHYNLKGDIQKHFNVPIYLENDANCAAIAEALFGELKGCKNGILATIGTAIGTGLIINEKLYKGSQGTSGELGWICNDDGTNFKKYSIKSFKDIIKQLLNLDNETKGEEIIKILSDKNNISVEINNVIEEYIRNLSRIFYNAICILNPEKIVIGGSFVYYRDIFLDKIRNSEELKTLKELGINTNIEIAKMGNNAGIIGAALGKNFN